MNERVDIGDAVLYCGDCREILPTLQKVNVLVTDPPYGVGFTGKVAKTREGNLTAGVEYASYTDTAERHAEIVIPAIKYALSLVRRAAITPGTRQLFRYPEPVEIGCFYSSAGTGMGRWGFNCSQPILFYGACPYLERGLGARANSFGQSYPNDANQTGHPCAKPLPQMVWLVGRSSCGGEIVLDPFMGSGTTGVACAQLGRKFIGIEIESRYFDIACERIENAQRQAKLFQHEAPPKHEQLEIAA